MHLVHFSFQKASYNFLTDHSCPVHGWLLYSITEASIHIDIFFTEILSSYNTKDIQFMVARSIGHKFLCHLGNIVIISTSHSLITGNHDCRYLSFLRRNQMTDTEKRMLRIRNMSENTCDRTLHVVEIRLRIRQYLFGFFHFGRGNHIHGIGNFHCVLNTVDPAFYFSCICHKFLLPFTVNIGNRDGILYT